MIHPHTGIPISHDAWVELEPEEYDARETRRPGKWLNATRVFLPGPSGPARPELRAHSTANAGLFQRDVPYYEDQLARELARANGDENDSRVRSARRQLELARKAFAHLALGVTLDPGAMMKLLMEEDPGISTSHAMGRARSSGGRAAGRQRSEAHLRSVRMVHERLAQVTRSLLLEAVGSTQPARVRSGSPTEIERLCCDWLDGRKVQEPTKGRWHRARKPDWLLQRVGRESIAKRLRRAALETPNATDFDAEVRETLDELRGFCNLRLALEQEYNDRADGLSEAIRGRIVELPPDTPAVVAGLTKWVDMTEDAESRPLWQRIVGEAWSAITTTMKADPEGATLASCVTAFTEDPVLWAYLRARNRAWLRAMGRADSSSNASN